MQNMMFAPCFVDAAPLPSAVGWRKRFGARKAGRVPKRRFSDRMLLSACSPCDMTTMRHRFTGQLRHVQVLDAHVVFGLEDGRQVRRSFRKALPWILNADRIGESN